MSENVLYKYDAIVRYNKFKRTQAISIIIFLLVIILSLRIKPNPYIVGFMFGTSGIACIIGIMGALFASKNHKYIAIFPRYFIIGDTVILYRNVSKLVLKGGFVTVLFIETKRGSEYTVERKKFITNARKNWKIKKNKKAGFDKVAAKILQKCTKYSENVNIQINNQPDLEHFSNHEDRL